MPSGLAGDVSSGWSTGVYTKTPTAEHLFEVLAGTLNGPSESCPLFHQTILLLQQGDQLRAIQIFAHCGRDGHGRRNQCMRTMGKAIHHVRQSGSQTLDFLIREGEGPLHLRLLAHSLTEQLIFFFLAHYWIMS